MRGVGAAEFSTAVQASNGCFDHAGKRAAEQCHASNHASMQATMLASMQPSTAMGSIDAMLAPASKRRTFDFEDGPGPPKVVKRPQHFP